MENNYLFIGGVFIESNKPYILNNSRGAIQNAANLLQWNYINGIEYNLGHSIDLLNATFVGTFPRYFQKIYVSGIGDYIDCNGRVVNDVGFFNLPYITTYSKYFSLRRKLKKWLSIHNKSPRIIAYGMFEHNIKLLSLAKQINKDAITCLIVPDLPEYMSLKGANSPIRKKYLQHLMALFAEAKNSIDFYSVITKQMGEYLNIEKGRYVVIDGMYNEKIINLSNENTSGKFSFLYTGGLSSSYGTDVLVESFLKMKNKKTELLICGDGPYASSLTDICKKEARIKYLGIVSQDECVKLQHQVSCLVNPRLDSEITKYSFPSKTMEYLASGKPVIAKRLIGMDREYDNLFYNFSSKDSLSEVMDKISNISEYELKQFAIKGKNYVLKNKNIGYQTNKLLEMMNTEHEA